MQSDSPKPIICLMGPTAAGKTGIAVDLVRQYPLDIISVDSALVYRGMDIGTAKPDAGTLQKAPHALIDICEPEEAYSAARFCKDALKEIESIRSKGRIPLLVGGTMLYYRALLEGLSVLPAANPQVRAELENEAAERGWPALHGDLQQLDPVVAERINPNDSQRTQRALEVIRISGQTMSSLQEKSNPSHPSFTALKIIICPEPRKVLHQRIEQRFGEMLIAGFVSEVKELRKRAGLSSSHPAMRAVGYRQCWEWLEGKSSEPQWQEKAIAATRQLAKRQLTWLRRENESMWYDLTVEGSTDKVFDAVGEFVSLHQ